MLEAHQISAGFGKTVLFSDVSLKLKRGNIYCVYGPSGCGKTTLGRTLAGLHAPSRGTITLGNKTAYSKTSWPVHYLYQSPLHAMNPRWNIGKIITESGPVDHAHAKRLDVRDEWMERYPHELSGGQLQRVSILRALGAKPEYLIADEITAALDPVAQAQIWQLLMHLVKEHNMGILAISHDMDLLKQITPQGNYLNFFV
ncbi:Oligopeptide transport ATP-binding protein OppF [Paenochrobactrum sp. BZR 201-1]